MATFRYSISLRSERYETTPCRNITSHDARDKRRQHPDKQRYHYNIGRCRYGEAGRKSVPAGSEQRNHGRAREGAGLVFSRHLQRCALSHRWMDISQRYNHQCRGSAHGCTLLVARVVRIQLLPIASRCGQ